MDIALGVSMTPTTVRMVLVEGEKADGVTVDHDTFDIATGEGTATAAEQVVAAILGTRESAAEGGHRLISTGITWTDHAAVSGLREALAARDVDDVVLVSELHAAGALAQAVGQAVGYERTALLFLERDTATLSVVETASGAIVKVQTQHLHAPDAVAELRGMVAGLETLDLPPQGLFILGAGIDVAAVKTQLALGTTLPVHAPEEAELALARGAALASATAPRFEASTVGLAYAQDPDGTTAGKAYPAGADTQMSEAGTQMAAAGYMAPLGYSEVPDEVDADLGYDAVPADLDFTVDEPGGKPFLLVGSALTSIFVVGVVALVISLAVSIRPTVDQRPAPGESVIVPSSQPAAPPAAPEAAPPPPPSTPSVPDTIQEPVPVVQQAPRTVYVTPAPQAPAPAAPAPEAPAPAPEAPPPPAPVIPAPVLAPPVIVLPPLLPPFLRPPRQPHYPSYPSTPSSPPPTYPSTPSSPPPSVPQEPPQEPSSVPQQPSSPSAPVTEAPSYPAPAAGSGGYGSGSGGSSSSSGSDGSRSSDSGSSRRGSGGSPLWPWPTFGH